MSERPRQVQLRHDVAAFPGPPFYFAPCIELLLGFGLQPSLGAEIGSIDSSSKLRSTWRNLRLLPARPGSSPWKEQVLGEGFTA